MTCEGAVWTLPRRKLLADGRQLPPGPSSQAASVDLEVNQA
jgi:hypothetical protein